MPPYLSLYSSEEQPQACVFGLSILLEFILFLFVAPYAGNDVVPLCPSRLFLPLSQLTLYCKYEKGGNEWEKVETFHTWLALGALHPSSLGYLGVKKTDRDCFCVRAGLVSLFFGLFKNYYHIDPRSVKMV